MRVLVIGRTGQVARALAKAPVVADNMLTLFFAGRPALDLAEPSSIDAAFAETRPELVINAAAYTAVDAAQSDAETAFAVNRDGPMTLARACAARGIPLIHLSTDYVFDGTKTAPYRETDPASPVSVYGQSKWEGEEAVRAALNQHVILRTAWVYAAEGKNFLLTMLRLGRERPELRVVDDQRGAPTAAGDISQALLSMARIYHQSSTLPWGTYHFTGGGATSWFGFAQAIFAAAEPWYGPAPRLVPIATADYPTPARRPANSILDCAKLGHALGIAAPPWADSVTQVIGDIGRRTTEGEKR